MTRNNEEQNLIQKILYECETSAAWSGHEYAVDYLKQEYDSLLKLASERGLDVSGLKTTHDESESYISTISNKTGQGVVWDENIKLDELNSRFIDCMYHTAEEFETFIIKNEP